MLACPELYMEIWEEGRKAGLQSGEKPKVGDKEKRRGELIREYQKTHPDVFLKETRS